MKESYNTLRGLIARLLVRPVSYAKRGKMPARDWVRIITVANLIVAMSIIFSYYIYVQVVEGTLVSVDNQQTNYRLSINISLLNKIVNDINDRKQATAGLEQNKPTVPDPSL